MPYIELNNLPVYWNSASLVPVRTAGMSDAASLSELTVSYLPAVLSNLFRRHSVEERPHVGFIKYNFFLNQPTLPIVLVIL